MSKALYSRRDFSRTAIQSFAAALAAPHLQSAMENRHAVPAPEGSIRINFNENNYGPSPKALEALANCGHIAYRYPFSAEFQMVDALAQAFGMKRENIILGCGSTEILRVADEAFLGPGKNVVAAEPTFESVLEYAGVDHASAVKIPLTADFRHDLPRMAAACTSKTGVIYICNPNNPTGTIVSHGEFADFVGRVPSSTLILVDEAYFDFVDDPSYSSVLEWIPKYPNVVIARTFSKIHGLAGMRLGYAVGSKETIAIMRPFLDQDNTNAAVLAAGLASLSDQANVAACRGKFIATRNWLCAELAVDGRSFTKSQANFLMINVGGDVQPIVDQFAQRNILVGRRFPSMSTWLRVSIGKQPEMESFLAALREIVPVSGSKAA
jgi:histidinol-phosphate aminotransferase